MGRGRVLLDFETCLAFPPGGALRDQIGDSSQILSEFDLLAATFGAGSPFRTSNNQPGCSCHGEVIPLSSSATFENHETACCLPHTFPLSPCMKVRSSLLIVAVVAMLLHWVHHLKGSSLWGINRTAQILCDGWRRCQEKACFPITPMHSRSRLG